MRTARLSIPAVALLLVFAIPAGASGGAVPAGKAVSGCLPGVVPNGFLAAVAASSSSNSWAVGSYSRSIGQSQTLAEHWNGSTWCQVTSPNPGSTSAAHQLSGVTVLSGSSAWAVGSYGSSTVSKTLVLHWNGTAWQQQASPNPAGFSAGSQLLGVAATSSANAWAVGLSAKSVVTTLTLITRWNGTRWVRVPSPNPGGTGSGSRNVLVSVAATSATNAWAVGYYVNSTSNGPVILHWNGTAWKQQAVTNPPPGAGLSSVAAVSPASAWAVGASNCAPQCKTLIEHWNGSTWTRQPSPNPPRFSFGSMLTGTAAASATDVWAAGASTHDVGPAISQTLTEHWNGTSWVQVPSPNPGGTGSTAFNWLTAVAALSPSRAWAVGASATSPTTTGHTLVEHWNGTAWKVQPSP